MARTGRNWLVSLACLLLAQTALAEVTIIDTTFVTLPGNKLEVRLDFNEAPPLPRSYMIQQPARVVLDLLGTRNGLNTKSIEIKTGLVDTIHFAEVKDRVRVIANLYESTEYDSYVEGNSLYIVLLLRPIRGEPTPDDHEVDRASYFSLAEIHALEQVPPINLEIAKRALSADRRLLDPLTVAQVSGATYTLFVG